MQDIPDTIKANIQQVQTLLTDTQALVDKLITSQQLQVQGLHMERERAEDKAKSHEALLTCLQDEREAKPRIVYQKWTAAMDKLIRVSTGGFYTLTQEEAERADEAARVLFRALGWEK